MIVSVPIDISEEDLPKIKEKGIIGRYVAVERILELGDDQVEWRMATSGTPAGLIPSFVVANSMPGQIAAVKFREAILSSVEQLMPSPGRNTLLKMVSHYSRQVRCNCMNTETHVPFMFYTRGIDIDLLLIRVLGIFPLWMLVRSNIFSRQSERLPSQLVTAVFHSVISCSLVPQKWSTNSLPNTFRATLSGFIILAVAPSNDVGNIVICLHKTIQLASHTLGLSMDTSFLREGSLR